MRSIRKSESAPTPRARDCPALPWAVLAYTALLLLGFGVFRDGDVLQGGNHMATSTAVFTTVNAATLTGFQRTVWGINELKPLGQGMALALIVGGALFALLAGGWAVVRVAALPYRDGAVAIYALAAFAAVAFLGATALTGARPIGSGGIWQAISAFANCGLYQGRLYGLLDWQTHAILLPLVVFGGCGLPVIMELVDAARGAKPLSPYARRVLAWTAALYLLGVILFIALQAIDAQLQDNPADWRQMAASSSVMAIDSRTAGLPFKFLSDFPRTMQWCVLVFMVVGASPGGAAGGLKTLTLGSAAAGARSALRATPVRRAAGIALAWIAVYLALALATFLVLLAVQPETRAEQLVFWAVSAVSNVGLSQEPISPGMEAMYTLSAAMLVGRLAPLAVLWWTANTDD